MKRLALLLFSWTAVTLGLSEWQYRQARKAVKRENEAPQRMRLWLAAQPPLTSWQQVSMRVNEAGGWQPKGEQITDMLTRQYRGG